MNPWILIIAQYGLEFAIALRALLQNATDPTAEDFAKLRDKYSKKSAQDYLNEAERPK